MGCASLGADRRTALVWQSFCPPEKSFHGGEERPGWCIDTVLLRASPPGWWDRSEFNNNNKPIHLQPAERPSLLWLAKGESANPQTRPLRLNLFAPSPCHQGGWLRPILSTERLTSNIAGYPNPTLKANSHSKAASYLTMDQEILAKAQFFRSPNTLGFIERL